MRNKWNLPDLGQGIGLRTVHFRHILEQRPPIDFFEIVTENFLDTGGRFLHVLDEVAQRYPVYMHGVSMSVGSADPLDWTYLRQLKKLADRLHAPLVSDHVCWAGVAGRTVHDLLPMPFNEASLKHTVQRCREVQDFLERPLVLENVSGYIAYKASTMPEWEFVARLAEAADIGVLLDVTSVYVGSVNHGFDPRRYIDAIPPERIVYHHLAGYSSKGTFLHETHDGQVADEVWDLYQYCHRRTGGRSTLLEWDRNVPSFEEAHREVLKAVERRATAGDDTRPGLACADR